MENNKQRQIITTGDGSKTIYLPHLDEQYHSKHGAINEARHVFIKNGFEYILKNKQLDTLDILEIGFGTGLNAFVTFLEVCQIRVNVNYTGVEAYPVSSQMANGLEYPRILSEEKYISVFQKMHNTNWEEKCSIHNNFWLTKRKQFFEEIEDFSSFDLIYFDAFGARVQPKLWTVIIFKKMYAALRYGGVLVTYSAKGSVRRAMIEVGFEVEKLPGPPGKREMLRAIKK